MGLLITANMARMNSMSTPGIGPPNRHEVTVTLDGTVRVLVQVMGDGEDPPYSR